MAVLPFLPSFVSNLTASAIYSKALNEASASFKARVESGNEAKSKYATALSNHGFGLVGAFFTASSVFLTASKMAFFCASTNALSTWAKVEPAAIATVNRVKTNFFIVLVYIKKNSPK